MMQDDNELQAGVARLEAERDCGRDEVVRLGSDPAAIAKPDKDGSTTPLGKSVTIDTSVG